MIGNFLAVAQQVAILFVLIGAGALMRRMRLLTTGSVEGLINVLILVVTPCLIVDVFQRPFDPSMLRGLGLAFLIAAAAHVAVIVAALLLVRHGNADIRRPLLLSAVFSNAGFMGIPLEQAMLGNGGVFYGIVYVVVFNLFMWSWGLCMMKKGERKAMNLHSIVNPGTVGIALGLPLFLCSVRLPAVLGVPVHQMANLNTSLAMLVIGYCLVGAKLGKVVRISAVFVAAGIRLVVFPLAVIAAQYPFRAALDRDLMLALVIAASAPVAAMVSMFASKFGRDVDVSVAVVSGTTLLSVFTMPPVIALAMAVL